MKKIIYTLGFCAILVSSCSEDLLDSKNLYGTSTESFYLRKENVQSGLTGAYNALYISSVNSEEHLTATLLGDEVLPGGGDGDKISQAAALFSDPGVDTYRDLWASTFAGVLSCNALIENVPNTSYRSQFNSSAEEVAFKNQVVGEAHFMRGFLLFRAARFFGGMPLILTIDANVEVPRASFAETLKQVISDFKKGAELMPATPMASIPASSYGHANGWVAKAFIARAFLFYTGYMTNIEKNPTSSIVLVDGSTMDATVAANYLVDVRDNSGFALVTKFANLWPYSQVNATAGSTVLPWAATEGLTWVGQDGLSRGPNTEVMFAERYSFAKDWGQEKYNNRASLFMGIRGNDMVPFSEGWGWCPVHPALYSDWSATDERRDASVITLNDAAQGTESYVAPATGDYLTGYYNKKYTMVSTSKTAKMFGAYYGLATNNEKQWCNAQDFYYLRFSDVLLMHSELTNTNTGLNAVRLRAGLPAIAYSLDALKLERLHEFAFEGVRWFDLVRWGDLKNGAVNYYDNAVPTKLLGNSIDFTRTYPEAQKGLLPIPEGQVELSKGVLVQNQGW